MRRAAVAMVLALTLSSCSSGTPRAATPVVTAPTTTTTTKPAGPTRPTRVADRNGLHYTLTLSTPTPPQLGIVRVDLRVENRTPRAVSLGQCVLGSIVVTARTTPRPIPPYSCGPNVTVGPSSSRTYTARTVAPLETGDYIVWPQALPRDAPPVSLLGALPLHVIPSNGDPTQTCTTADLHARGVVPMPTPQFVTQHTPVSDIGISGISLDPPTDLKLIKITAQQAWQLAKQQGLVGNSPFGTYQIKLTDLKIDTPEPAGLAWVISGQHVAVSNGQNVGPTGPTGPEGPTDAAPGPPPRPCFFVDAGVAFDAVTGRLIGQDIGEPRAP